MASRRHWTFWATALLIVATPGTGAIHTLYAGCSLRHSFAAAFGLLAVKLAAAEA
jgi:threonine/homoserine/homoserine lactone efflux protein